MALGCHSVIGDKIMLFCLVLLFMQNVKDCFLLFHLAEGKWNGKFVKGINIKPLRTAVNLLSRLMKNKAVEGPLYVNCGSSHVKN
jgi:hypothetical protein